MISKTVEKGHLHLPAQVALQVKMKPKGEDFEPEIDMANPSFKVGLQFAIAEMFRKAMRIYSINYGRELIFMNNDRNKIRVVCEEGCPFVIHASSISGSTYLQVKTIMLCLI